LLESFRGGKKLTLQKLYQYIVEPEKIKKFPFDSQPRVRATAYILKMITSG
jgi:hypothetical protein